MNQIVRYNNYIEEANTDVLLERLEHMRKLLVDKDKEIKSCRERIEIYERLISGKFQKVEKNGIT